MGTAPGPRSVYTAAMRSPFPGMDPYLERYWDDVHISLCAEIRTALQPDLPKGLRARAGQNIRLETPAEEPGPGNRFEGDTVLVATGPAARRRASHDPDGGPVATVEPVVLEAVPAAELERWVQIIDTADGNRVVTVIEVLSPGNKASGGLNKRYRRKLIQYARAGVSLVEIDLLRSSRARLTITTEDVPARRRAAYYTCVNWASDPSFWNVYPMPLRDPLPSVPVPCRPGEKDVPLALQPIIDRIYVEGGHDDINYAGTRLRPRLSPADAAWAADLIAKRPAPPAP